MLNRFDIICITFATLLVSTLFLWHEFTISGTWGFPLDDTWIHMQFARNISTRGEFAFNIGEPISASTAPLWTLLLALVYSLFFDVVWATKAVGVLLLWGCGILTILLAREIGLGKWMGLFAGFVVVVTPRLVWGSLSGMEVILYTFLSTAGTWLHIRSIKSVPSLIGTVCFALASLTRPECILLFPLAIIDRWLIDRKWQRIYLCYKRHVIVFGCVILPSVIFNLYTIGKPLPNTFYAKVGPYGLLGALSAGDVGRIVKVLFFYPLLQAQEVAQFGLENQLLIAVLLPLGFVWLFLSKESGRSLLMPIILISFPLLRGVLAPFQGALFQHGRYAAHLIPLMTVMGLGGGVWIKQILSNASTSCWPWVYRGGLAVIVLNFVMMNVRYAQVYGQDVENIEQMHVHMGQWLAKNTPKDAVLATHDIGAIGYFSGRKVLDTVGLVTPEILPFLHESPSRAQGVWAFLQDQTPDYVIVLSNWYPDLSARTDMLKPIYNVQLNKVTVAAGARMVVYRPVWNK